MTPRITGSPTRLSRPMSKQAFRPGQWNGVRVGGGNKTYIQNNFYGGQTNYRGWGDAWAGYDYSHCDCENNKPGVLDWAAGIAALTGKVLDLFGVGKKDKADSETPGNNEKGSKTTPTQDSTTTTKPESTTTTKPDSTTTTKPDSTTTTKPESTTTTKPESTTTTTTTQTEQDQINAFDWNSSSFETDVRDVDANGKDKKKPIKGKVTVADPGESGKAPKKFTIKTAAGNTYTFEKESVGTDGTIKYKCTQCVTKGGTKTEFQKGNLYTCEMQDNKPVLRQHEGDAGSGFAVGYE